MLIVTLNKLRIGVMSHMVLATQPRVGFVDVQVDIRLLPSVEGGRDAGTAKSPGSLLLGVSD